MAFFLVYVLVFVSFLCWWSWWRNKRKTVRSYDETLILLFLIKQRDSKVRHSVFFGETSGTIAPTLGNTHGRYENLSFMCPSYEFEPELALICPESLRVSDLHNSVGAWIDKYWEHRFKEKK